MYQEERLLQILDYLKVNQRISVNEMMDLYGISRDTARRDLVKLVEQDKVIRTRGGAILPSETKSDEMEQFHKSTPEFRFDSKDKRIIAERTLDFIQNGENIMLDGSIIAQYLADILDVPSTLVVTNSIHQVQLLRHNKDVEIHLLGGKLDKESNSFYGAAVMDALDRYFVDKVIIGADGVTTEGITFSNAEDGRIRNRMAGQGKEIIILADSSAFGNRELYRGIAFENIDMLITNRRPDNQYLNLLEMFEVELIVT